MPLEPERLLEALGLTAEEIPVALILEGSWWQKQRNESRLSRLENARELGFPELHHGYIDDAPIVYSCVYGAPRAVEPIHIFAGLGTRRVVLIGSCGALQPGVRTGDVVIPSKARVGEGATQYYDATVEWSKPDSECAERARAAVEGSGTPVHSGPLLTTSALFAQGPERIEEWKNEGYLGVDMETSAVFSVARVFGLEAVSLVFAWDELYKGRSFLDEFSEAERAAQIHANDLIYDVALALAASTSMETTRR
jgi:purine-nucleoside phosphorylase